MVEKVEASPEGPAVTVEVAFDTTMALTSEISKLLVPKSNPPVPFALEITTLMTSLADVGKALLDAS